MANQGFHLNPFEASTLQALIGALGHPGTADLASQVGLPLIQGAETRRATNIQTRDQGLQQLQQQAMQLAAQGASQDAVQAAVLGQANDLPLMGGQRGANELGGLASYVQGLDWQPTDQGPISGLAPADYRQQFQSTTSGLDPTAVQDIGTQVITDLQGGVPFVQTREKVRRAAISLGLDEAGVNQAVAEAEKMYGQAAGMPLDQMRAMGDTLRAQQQQSLASDTAPWYKFWDQGPQTTFDYSQYGLGSGDQFNQANVQAVLAQLANQPGMLQQLQAQLGR